MKNSIKIVCTLLVISFQMVLSGQTLNEKIKFLEPILGNKWVGEMKSPDGKNSFTVELIFESIWNGGAVKFSRSNPTLNFFKEGYIYWDDNLKKLLLFSLANRGGAETGEVIYEDGKITIQGKSTIQGRTFDYKNTFEHTPEGKLIDSWFQNAFGPWNPGHVIEFSKK